MTVALSHARDHRLAGDYTGALSLLGPVQDNEPPDVAVERGLAWFGLENWPEVVWALRPLPPEYLAQAEIAARLAESLAALGRLHEAFEAAARVQLPGLASLAADYAIAAGDRVQAQAQIARVKRFDSTYPRIRELEEAVASIDEELAAARAAWNEDPESVTTLSALCEVLFDRGLIPHAFELARISVNKAEQLPDLWRVFVAYMKKAGMTAEERVAVIRPVALSQIAIGMPIDGEEMSQMADAPQMRPVEAYALLRQGRDAEASALAEGVDDPLARYVVAWAKARAGEGSAALEAMLATESDPWIKGLTWLALCVTHYRAQDWQRAIEQANHAVELLSKQRQTAPTDIGRAHLIAAACHEKLGDVLGMRTAAKRGLDVVGKRPPADELRIMFNNSFC